MTEQAKTLFLPTLESCEDYRLRRFHTDYSALTTADGQVGANSGFGADALDRLGALTENAVGVDIPGFGPPGIEDQRVFLAGPQFKNKPQNILQDVASQYTLGIYNGPESAWWSSKSKQNQPLDENGDELAIARTTNSVWIHAKKNTPFKIKTIPKTVNGQEINVTEYDYGGGDSEESLTLWKMNVLPNWNQDDGLEFSHDHEWGKADDIFSQLLGTVGDIVAGGSRLMQGIRDAGNGLAGGANQPKSNIQTDVADTYQRTNRLEVTLPFTLFTRNHFYRDILAPIMLLNFLSFPKRRSVEDAASELNDLVSGIVNKLPDSLKPVDADGNVEPINAIGSTEKFMNSVMPGFRIFALEPPSYFNIEHSAGLFKFKNCAVTNFSYKYMGPWINTTNHPQDQDVSQNAGGPSSPGGSLLRSPKKDWWAFWKTDESILDATWTKAKLSYPIRADCSITFRMIDPIFADDWLDQLRNYQEAWATTSTGFDADTQKGKPGSDILNL